MAFCSNCGNPLTPGMAFCDNCGARVEPEPAAQAPQAQPFVQQAAQPAAQPQQGYQQPTAPQQGYQQPAQPAQPQAPVYGRPVTPPPAQSAGPQPSQQSYQPAQPQAPVYGRPVTPPQAPSQQPVYGRPVTPPQAPSQQPVYGRPVTPPQPSQQSYQQPVYQAPPVPTQPAKKKSKAGLIILIVILALVLIGGLITAAVLLLPKLTGGSNGDAGYYVFDSITGDGSSYTKDDFPLLGLDKSYLLLNEDGTGRINYAGILKEFTWTKGKIRYNDNSFEATYIRKGDTISFENADDGTIANFKRSDGTPPVQEMTVDKAINTDASTWNALQSTWNGTWYGVLLVSGTSGDYYAQYDYRTFDTYAVIYTDEAGDAALAVYIENSDSESAFLSATGTAYDYSIDAESGYLLDSELTESENVYTYLSDGILTISGTYTDYSGDYIDFVIYLKPYGEYWDDVIASESIPVPPGYKDYAYNIDNGYSAPYGFGVFSGSEGKG